jgi:diaminobutyrate-2-oxoglutarate transaminase
MTNNTKIFDDHESEVRTYCKVVPSVFKSCKNATMTDENDKLFIDFFAGAGVVNFGHNNPKMQDAIVEFIRRDGVVHSLDMHTDVKREFIDTFVQNILLPRGWGDRKLQFTGPTGSNAVEAALKLARKATGRTEVVVFNRAFHGMTLGALACTANNHYRSSSGVPLNNIIRGTFDDMDALDEMKRQMLNTGEGLQPPAAFLVEPIQGEGGVRIASKQWLHAIQKFAKQCGALLIFDDIQGSSGRHGSYFSFDGLELDPDIIVLAKGLGGIGTPIGMLVNKPEVDKVWEPGQHTGTFRGQGISFVAGKVALDYFKDEKLNDETKRKGKIIEQHLRKIQNKYKDVVDVRARGMMVAIEFSSTAIVNQITKKTYEHGLIVGACSSGEIIKLIPPLTIEDDTLNDGLAIFEQCIDEVLS